VIIRLNLKNGTKVLKTISNLYSSLCSWFYTTYVGGLYFEFLLWIDRRTDRPSKYLTPKEMAAIVRESSQIAQGVTLMKRKVNELIQTKSKEEYKKILKEIEDLIPLSEQDENSQSDRAKFASILRDIYVKKGDRDIVTSTDKAKMIENRIKDMKELHDHIAKRNLLREIRSARNSGDVSKAAKLEQEFYKSYGRSNSRH
jgi:hypothetical protein